MTVIKILNFGSCNIDYVYFMDHIVKAGETQSTYKLELFPGGKGLNQSIAIARAGAKVYHAGCIGCDGDMLVELLSDSGVDVSHIRKVDEKNGHAVIQVDSNGQNAIFLCGGSNEMITEELVDSVLDDFGAGDIILLQNEINNVEYIIEKASRKQMCIIFNPSPLAENISQIDFSRLSYIILNEIEAQGISGCSDPDGAIAYFRSKYPRLRVLLTLGEKGSVYDDGVARCEQFAFKVTAVDTTGAGDTFTGYFVAGVASDTDLTENLRISSAAAAIAVSREGAASSIPNKKEVLDTVDQLKINR